MYFFERQWRPGALWRVIKMNIRLVIMYSRPFYILKLIEGNINSLEIDMVRLKICLLQEIKIDANFMPPEANEFEISEAGHVTFEARSFSKLSFLQKVTVKNTDNLVIRRDAFSNLVVPQFFLEIKDCKRVEIESKAFFIMRGPVAVYVTRCDTLLYNSEAIPWISEAVISDVKDAAFGENAFSQYAEKALSRHGSSTKVS